MDNATYPFGYCTNVHAGIELEQAQANLQKFAFPIREKVCPDLRLPVGLWLTQQAANSLSSTERAEVFKRWMQENGLAVYTFNGFPQGDFHQPVVKHEVYEPTWRETSRFDYTKQLAKVMALLLEPDQICGSISTLPLGWPHQRWVADDYAACAKQLKPLAAHLRQIYETTGKEIVLAIEPEPGCVLNTANEIADFFSKYLFNEDNSDVERRHLGVCHDICHSGVMFEPQETALQLYHDAEIRIGKVQVSSAVHVPWDQCVGNVQRQSATLEQLRTFSEPKYLHQTTRCDQSGQLQEMCTDLPIALKEWIHEDSFPEQQWRIHFHVPIYVSEFDFLGTTQNDILQATKFLENHKTTQVAERDWFTGHYEVETYAWPVLPQMLAEEDLSTGIGRELEFFHSVLNEIRTSQI